MKVSRPPSPHDLSFPPAAGALVIALAVLAAYANTFSSPFTFDDGASIVDNLSIRHLWPLWRPLAPPGAGGITVGGRPMLNLSLALNYAISGNAVWSYHAVNLLIHVLAALALFGIVRRTLAKPGLMERSTKARQGAREGAGRFRGLLERQESMVSANEDSETARALTGSLPSRFEEPLPGRDRFWLALAIALLWGLHPLQTEAVTYIVQRAESLMGLFYLMTLYGFIRSAEAGGRGKRGASASWAAFSWGACLLGMGTKEVMVSAPFMVWLYDRTFVAGGFREAWRRRGIYYIALGSTWIPLASLIYVNGGNRGGTIGFGSGVGVAWWTYGLSQFRAIIRYLRLSLWPHPLVFDYGTIWAKGWGDAAPYALGVLLLAAATAVALVRRPVLGFLGVWFFAILSPSSSVIPGNRQTIAEHRMYLPLAAIAVLAAAAAWSGLGRTGSRILLAAAAVALGVATYARNQVYRSELSLYADTLARVPANPYTHSDYGNALLNAGRAAEAEREFTEALRLKPGYAKALYNLGAALDAEGRYAEAVESYRKSLRLNPNDPAAQNNMANSLIRLGRPKEALDHFAAALHANPDFSVVHYNYANTLASVGRTEEALPHYEAALRRDPGLAEAHNNYGIALASTGRLADGLREFEIAVRLKPGDVPARYNLGNAYLITGHCREAIAQFEAVLRLDPGYAAAQRNLAVAKSRL